MTDEAEAALVAKYKGTPDYADGYDDGLNGRPLDFVSEAFDCGHRAGQRAVHAMTAPTYDRYWRLRVRLPERHGQPCRMIARGTMNSAVIEFADGVRHVVSRNAFRKLPLSTPPSSCVRDRA